MANPSGEPYTPAFFTQLSDVQKTGRYIRFSYRHLTKALSSEEVFGSELFDTEDWEHSRTHWAVKKGNLVSKLFELLDGRGDPNLPKLFDIKTWPLPRLDHVAVMMPFSVEFTPIYDVIKAVCEEVGCPALRVDEIYGPTKIINDVFSAIAQSRLVVCDLTGKESQRSVRSRTSTRAWTRRNPVNAEQRRRTLLISNRSASSVTSGTMKVSNRYAAN